MEADVAALRHRLTIWAREGNRDAALEELGSQPPDLVRDDQRRALMFAIDTTPAPVAAIFIPLVYRRGSPDLTTSVHLEPDTEDGWGFQAGPDAQAAIARALEAAWVAVGGRGPRPAAKVVLGLAEAGAEPLEVDGSSLYLGVYLAAVHHYADGAFAKNVLVTGAPGTPLGHLERKRRLFHRVREHLHVRQLWVMGEHLGVIEGQVDLCRVASPESAIDRLFGFRPWWRGAPCDWVHVFTADKWGLPPKVAERALADASDIHAFRQPLEMTPADVLDAARSVNDFLQTVKRCEMVIGGPIVLAAALGQVSRNIPAPVRIIDPRPGHAAWSNQVPLPDHVCQAPRDRAYVLVAPRARDPGGWEPFATPDSVDTRNMAPLVMDFLGQYGGTRELHLAFSCPLVLAWAIAGMLKTSGHHIYYHYDDATCAKTPWFEERGKRLRLPEG